MQLIIILVVVGVILWAIINYSPMQAGVKRILNAFGVLGSTSRLWIGSW